MLNDDDTHDGDEPGVYFDGEFDFDSTKSNAFDLDKLQFWDRL